MDVGLSSVGRDWEVAKLAGKWAIMRKLTGIRPTEVMADFEIPPEEVTKAKSRRRRSRMLPATWRWRSRDL